MAQAENKWTVLGRWVWVAGPIVAITLFVAGRGSKAVSIETISRAVVADLTDPALSLLKLTYQDMPVDRVTTVTLELANIGTRPIERLDFERPLVIRFSDSNSLLAVTVGEKQPPNLDPRVEHDLSTVTIAPMLLNPGDRFRLTLHLRGGFSEPLIDARISGIPQIQRRELPELYRRQLVSAAVFGLLSIASYGYLAMFFFGPRRHLTIVPRIPGLVVTIILASVGVLLWGQLLGASHSTIYYVGAILPIIPAVFAAFWTDRRIRSEYEIVRKSNNTGPAELSTAEGVKDGNR